MSSESLRRSSGRSPSRAAGATALVRHLHGEAAQGQDRTQPLNRRPSFGGCERAAIFPDEPGTPQAAQPLDVNRSTVVTASHAGFALLRYLRVPETATQRPLL